VNLLADENVDRAIVDRLREDGHEVRYVAEMEPGISDDFVLDEARREGAVLLTADKDFGEVVWRQRHLTTGVVLIRLAGLPPARKAEIVSGVIREHGSELLQAFAVITPRAVRVRRRQ